MQYQEGSGGCSVTESSSAVDEFDEDAVTGEYAPGSRSRASSNSFEELCVPYYGEMLCYARRLASDHALAADIVHDSLVKAMLAWPSWEPADPDDPEHSARAWLYRIVANTFTKSYHHRRIRQHAAGAFREDVLRASYGTHESHYDPRRDIDSPLGDEVAEAFERLSPDHRAVIDAHYVDGKGCEQIARELGIPKNTVFTRLKRARTQLERRLGPYARECYNLRRVDLASVSAEKPTEGVQSDASGVDGVVRGDDSPALLCA